MPRLFTGLEIPADLALTLTELRGGLPGATWIDPENYHVTLRFIGDVDERIADEIADALARVRRPAFDVRIRGIQSEIRRGSGARHCLAPDARTAHRAMDGQVGELRIDPQPFGLRRDQRRQRLSTRT